VFLGNRLLNGSPYAIGPVSCPVCNVRVLWPNAWTDQDQTWHAGRPRPRPHRVRWGPRSPNPKKGHSAVGPCLLRPNGWVDLDATWYGGRPRPKRPYVRWGPNKKGEQPPVFGPCLFWSNGWMHQDTTWYGGRPQTRRHCVRWGPALSPQKGDTPLQFWPMSIVAIGSPISATAELL